MIDEIGAEKDTVSLSSFAKKAQAEDIEKKAGEELSSGAKKQVFNSAQIAAQMMQEEEEELKASSVKLSQPTEEDDPVLQRILANQKRQAVSSMQ